MSKHLALLEPVEVGSSSVEGLPSDAEIERMMSPSAEDQVLATVEERFGYVPPSVKVKRGERFKMGLALVDAKRKAKLPLALVLGNVGIKPFTPTSVEAYKKAMTKRRFQIWEKQLTDGQGALLLVLGLVLNTAIFACPGWIASAKFGGQWGHLTCLALIPAICFAVALKLAHKATADTPVVVLLTVLSSGSTVWVDLLFGGNLEWKAVPLRGYKKDIPRPVLEIVAEIHTRCPSASFEVEELTTKRDPFLVVSHDSESYHVAVWNEPKYEQEELLL